MVVDPGFDPTAYDAEPARAWRDIDFAHAPNGRPNDATHARLVQLLRDARRSRA
jgi:hypothetical protein